MVSFKLSDNVTLGSLTRVSYKWKNHWVFFWNNRTQCTERVRSLTWIFVKFQAKFPQVLHKFETSINFYS